MSGGASGSITIPNSILVDHPVVDPTNQAYGWFARNQWHQLSYYAIAQPLAPDGSSVCTSADCLIVNYSNVGDTRGLIVIAGRRLSGQAPRPNGNLPDWFEGENADFSSTLAARTYTARDPTLIFNRGLNDRISVIDTN